MTWYLHTLQNTTVSLVNIRHHTKLDFIVITSMTYFLCNSQIYNTKLLTTDTKLYLCSHDLLITGNLYLLIPFTDFTHTSYPLQHSPIYCLYLWSLLSFSDSTYVKWYYSCLSLSTYFTQRNTLQSIHIFTSDRILLFLMVEQYSIVCIYPTSSLFI